MFRLLFELNRRMPNGTYGGVRGIINLYSMEGSCPVVARSSGHLFASARTLAEDDGAERCALAVLLKQRHER